MKPIRCFTVWSMLSCLLMALPEGALNAREGIEWQVRLDLTYLTGAGMSSNSANITCVIETNRWFFKGNFFKNGESGFWFFGTHVIEHRTITNNLTRDRSRQYLLQKIPFLAPQGMIDFKYPKVGETFTILHPSPMEY